MTTAAGVPVTHGELEGDDALATLRSANLRRLVPDVIDRFRAADGFSHSRALAFQATLTILPLLIAIVGFASSLDEGGVRRVVEGTIDSLAPGAAGDTLRSALKQGSEDAGETALALGGFAALLAGASAMGQIERGANRIYGVERDRPFTRKYTVAAGLALVAGALIAGALVALLAGGEFRRNVGFGSTLETVWDLLRWPLGIVAVVAAVAVLFQVSPHRRQPEPSWLAFGAGLSALLWLVFMALLRIYLDATGTFGQTYGPIAGTIGVLLWTFATAVALFLGLAFAAQLEAVRAGAPATRRPD